MWSGIVKRTLRTSAARAARITERRKPFNQLEGNDVAFMERLLGCNKIITDTDDLQKYNNDWLRTCEGSSRLALFPTSSAEVAEILRYCNKRKLAVVPQGGNTGLVGGSVPLFDEVILSTEKMNKIHQVDELTGISIVDAGVILERLDQYVNSYGLTVPLDLASKGSCHIGGNISTNAGGVRLLKYGSLHGSVLGLEVVLADGTVLDGLSTMRKDNTGVDMKQLFIGSEGILGVVTKAAWLLSPRSNFSCVAIVGCRSFENVLKVFTATRRRVNEFLSAVEMFDAESLQCVRDNLKLSNPLQSNHPFYVLIEVQGNNGAVVEEALNGLVEEIIEKEFVADGVAASDSKGMSELWQRRERISESIKMDGYVYKYDMSVPLQKYLRIAEMLKPRVRDLAKRVCAFGHLGDGNVHFNVTAERYSDELLNLIEPFVYEEVVKLGGSISAEHGVGIMKKKYLPLQLNERWIGTMTKLKQTLDPNGILNPYKVI